MIYDGIIIKIQKKFKDYLFLFFLNPKTYELSDGVNISNHKVYEHMTYNQIMVVKITLKDGTLELDDVDIDEFINGNKYGREDIFLHIQDILLYDVNLTEKNNITTKEIVNNGQMKKLALELIERSKEDVKNI